MTELAVIGCTRAASASIASTGTATGPACDHAQRNAVCCAAARKAKIRKQPLPCMQHPHGSACSCRGQAAASRLPRASWWRTWQPRGRRMCPRGRQRESPRSRHCAAMEATGRRAGLQVLRTSRHGQCWRLAAAGPAQVHACCAHDALLSILDMIDTIDVTVDHNNMIHLELGADAPRF